MKVVLFFTFNTSLKDWEDSGFIEREANYYNYLTERYKISFTFVTYGDEADIEIGNKYFNSDVFPINSSKRKSNRKVIIFLTSLIYLITLRKEINSFDLIKTNQLNGSWLAIIFSWICKKPIIIRTGYDILSFKIKENVNAIKINFYYLLTLAALKFGNLYFSTSKVDIELLNARFPKYKNKIMYLPNWVYDLESNPNSAKNFNKLISIGRLESQKNYAEMILALKNSTYQLNIIGVGSKKNELENLAKDCNIKISFLGKIPNSELIKQLEGFKFYISTSKYEGNPKAILEAMNAGCVIITKNNLNIREIINNNENGIIYNDDSELISILDSLVKNEKKISYLSQNAFATVQRTNRMSLIAHNEFQAYKSLII